MPGPGSIGFALATAGTAVVATAGLFWGSTHHPVGAGVVVAAAALATGALMRGQHPGVRRPGGARQVAMAVVPWGVLVDPDTEPRVLRWPAVRAVTVDVAHTMRGGTPAVVGTVVTIDTGHERLSGRTVGAAGLEGLTVNLAAYAEEAARPVALDLDGFEEAGDGATEPVVADLFDRARELCTTGRGAVRLALPPGGYRSVAGAAAGPETLKLLRGILTGSDRAPGPADPRPLAAVVAALLGARALVPALLGLASAPHPVVAAVAKAAAIRLGAGRNRAGSIGEVAPFLFEEDRERLDTWADEGEAVADGGLV
jgi:hypothetical protein